MVLDDIMKVKDAIALHKEAITALKESSGLNELEKQLKELELQKEQMIAAAMVANITKEGNLMIIASGRRMRELNQIDFKHEHPEIFDRYAKITITAAMEAFINQHSDLPTKEAKQLANDEIERFSITKEPTAWDVISLV